MKNRNIRYQTTIPAILTALALACLSWQAAQAGKGGGRGGSPGGSIIGLWDVHYTSDVSGGTFETYDQWHSDGLEFEVAGFAPGAMCQGTWKQMSSNMVQLFHVGFTFGGGCPGTDVRFEETQTLTVSLDGNSYDGTYDDKYYDATGNLVCEDTGTLHATRLSVH